MQVFFYACSQKVFMFKQINYYNLNTCFIYTYYKNCSYNKFMRNTLFASLNTKNPKSVLIYY